MHHAVNNLTVSYSNFARIRDDEELLSFWGKLFDEVGGTQFNYVWWLNGTAGNAYARGDWDKALEFAERFLATLPPGGTHVVEPESRYVRGMIFFARGDTDAALSELHRAIATSSVDDQTYGPLLAKHAAVDLALGRVEQAAETFDTIVAGGQKTLRNLRGNFGLIDLLWIAIDLGRRDAVA